MELLLAYRSKDMRYLMFDIRYLWLRFHRGIPFIKGIERFLLVLVNFPVIFWNFLCSPLHFSICLAPTGVNECFSLDQMMMFKVR